MRPFCPTRWTVKALSLNSVIHNYKNLTQYFEELAETDRTESGAKAAGFNRQLNQFDNFFMLNLLYQVLSCAETVNVALQKMNMNYFQSQMMLSGLKDCWNEKKFRFILGNFNTGSAVTECR